jgi:hypothetical protein
MWVEIMPGVWTTAREQAAIDRSRLQEARKTTREAELNVLREWKDRPQPHGMQEAGAAFLLELEQASHKKKERK